MQPHPSSSPGPVSFRRSMRGIWALCRKEIRRFLKVYHQTIIAPIVTALLFLAVFVLAMEEHVSHIGALSFTDFMASGLIIMTIVQAGFANTSSVLIQAKITGNIIDYLMPPFTPNGLILALTVGGVVRAVIVGILLSLCLWAYMPLHVYDWALICFYTLSASLLLSLFGILTGLLSDTFDQASAMTNYIVTPLSFLSGTFYSIHALPPMLYHAAHYNPFFYMIDGFRYSLTGYHEASITCGIWLLTGANLLLWGLCYLVLRTGYRIKS